MPAQVLSLPKMDAHGTCNPFVEVGAAAAKTSANRVHRRRPRRLLLLWLLLYVRVDYGKVLEKTRNRLHGCDTVTVNSVPTT